MKPKFADNVYIYIYITVSMHPAQAYIYIYIYIYTCVCVCVFCVFLYVCKMGCYHKDTSWTKIFISGFGCGLWYIHP